MSLNQNQIKDLKFADITAAKAAGRPNEVCFVESTRKTYFYLTSGAAYTADDEDVLTTQNGGDTRWVSSLVSAQNVIIPGGIGTPTYDDLQDWLNLTQSSGKLTGGAITANDPGVNALLDISELEGLIKTTNAVGGTIVPFKKAVQSGISPTGITDGAVNWIYLDYDSGSLTYKATIDRTAIHEYDQFVIGRIWISGNTIEILSVGMSIYNFERRIHNRLILKYGAMDHVSGGVVAKHATALRLTCSDAVWYTDGEKFTTALADTFQVWYKSGSATWQESGVLTLFSEVFDGGTSEVFRFYQDGETLSALTNYGVYWLFMCPEGDFHVVLGTANYANVTAAQSAEVPTALPPYLVNWGRLIGKVICQKQGAALYSVETVFGNDFSVSSNIAHNDTANLNTDAYRHAPASAAASDFIVGEAATGNWVKKTLAETQAILDHLAIPGADHTWTGETITATAGENLTIGQVAYQKSDGKFWKTDADAVATAKGLLLMATASISADASGVFLKCGFLRDDDFAWTIGAELFLDTATAGGMTETAPSGTDDVVRLVGYAWTADIVRFDPDKSYVVVTA